MTYTIKEAAEKVSLTAHTLRFYENEGLIPYIERDSYGNRIFKENNMEWLQFILCLRNTGMSIKDMKHFVDLVIQGDFTLPERKEILYKHRENLEIQLQEMARYLKNINHKIDYYEGLS